MHSDTPQKKSPRRILNIIMSSLFAVLGAATVVIVIYICIQFADALPQLTFTPDQPRARVAAMMDCS